MILEKYLKYEEWEQEYFSPLSEMKRVSVYTGLNFSEILNIPYSIYKLYVKESWIDSWNSSSEGRELLKTLWRLKQTKADLKAIRNKTGGDTNG